MFISRINRPWAVLALVCLFFTSSVSFGEIRKVTREDIEIGNPEETVTSAGGHVGHKISYFAVQPGWVDVRDHGAIGNGVVDDTVAIQSAATAAEGSTLVFPEPSVNYKVTGSITLLSNTTVLGSGRPLIVTTSTTMPIFVAGAVSNVTIQGLRLQGGGSGGAAGDEGLISINPSFSSLASNIRIMNNEISDFRNGISAIRVFNLWIEQNQVHNFLLYGILASRSYNFHIDRNNVYTCNQSGAANAYGIMATGNDAGGQASKRCSISFNHIDSIPSWDGIMTHDIDGLQIIGNDIRNVRTGIDVGHSDNTNVIRNVIISDNFIQSTDTDTWSGAGAVHGGIVVVGYDNTHAVENITISGNIVRNFYNVPGLVPSGDYSNISVSNVYRATIVGNAVVGSGSESTNAGIYCVGIQNGLVVQGNSLQGDMSSGGIRFAGVTATTASVTGNNIVLDDTSDYSVYVTNSTITELAFHGNSTNATTEYAEGTSTVNFQFPRMLTATASLDFDLSSVTFQDLTINVVGAAIGDVVSLGTAHASVENGIVYSAWVSSTNWVTVRAATVTGTPNPSSGTFRVVVWKY